MDEKQLQTSGAQKHDSKYKHNTKIPKGRSTATIKAQAAKNLQNSLSGNRARQMHVEAMELLHQEYALNDENRKERRTLGTAKDEMWGKGPYKDRFVVKKGVGKKGKVKKGVVKKGAVEKGAVEKGVMEQEVAKKDVVKNVVALELLDAPLFSEP